jgi:hypothetical protein
MMNCNTLKLVPMLILAMAMLPNATFASSCDSKSVDARVRNRFQDSGGIKAYHVAFDVSDSCPDGDRIEHIYVSYKYKARWSDGSIHEADRVVSGYIEPAKSHHTVVNDQFQLNGTETEILDVYVSSVSVT